MDISESMEVNKMIRSFISDNKLWVFKDKKLKLNLKGIQFQIKHMVSLKFISKILKRILS